MNNPKRIIHELFISEGRMMNYSLIHELFIIQELVNFLMLDQFSQRRKIPLELAYLRKFQAGLYKLFFQKL